MAERISIASGKWLKYDRYEIREGCIAPVRGSKARVYDPWTLRERPYHALVELGASPGALTLPAEQPELVAAVIKWCNRYGLLGTLLHRLVAVTFCARWKRPDYAAKLQQDIFVPEQRTHVHVPVGWRSQATEHLGRRSSDPSQLGLDVPREELPADALQPGALVMDLPGIGSSGGVIKQEPLDKTWAEHFPDVPFGKRSTYDYPAPGSWEFWSIYGEPVYEFVEAAWLLANALDAISQPRAPSAVPLGLMRLTELAARTSPGLERQRDGSLRQRWVSGSLLSTLALMAMEDLAADRLHRCATCERLFLSSAHQVEYCSAKCRQTMQKRRFRSKYPDYERRARQRRVEQKET